MAFPQHNPLKKKKKKKKMGGRVELLTLDVMPAVKS